MVRPKLPENKRRIRITVRVLPSTQKAIKRIFKKHGGLGRYIDKIVENGRAPD